MGSGSSASKKWLSPFQTVKKWYTVHVDKNEISAFLTCKKLNKYGAEGGQGAIGKPPGRAEACVRYKKNATVAGWRLLLSEDEAYVIKRHVIDGITCHGCGQGIVKNERNLENVNEPSCVIRIMP